MRSLLLRVPLLVAFTLAAACGGASTNKSASSQAKGAASPPVVVADCRYLSDRVSSTFVRLKSLAGDTDNAAKYHAIGDLLDRFAQDLDKPFVTPELAGVARDYREAARATAAVAHEGATMLSDGAASRRSMGGTEDLQAIMDSIITRCRGRAVPDCEKMVQILRTAASTKAADIDRANRALLDLQITTPGLADDRVKLSAAFTKLADAARQGERLTSGAEDIGERFTRASKQFSGLDVRAKQICTK